MNLREMIGSFFPKKEQPPLAESIPLDFVKTKRGILKELAISNVSGNVVGIYSRALGQGMFLAAVEKIESTPREEIIILNRYDMSGQMLLTTKVGIDEIHMVCPFNRTYANPYVNAR